MADGYEPVLTADEVAKRLNRSKKTILRWADEGVVTRLHPCGGFLWSKVCDELYAAGRRRAKRRAEKRRQGAASAATVMTS